MLIIDNRKNIPFDSSRLDWNRDNIKQVAEEVIAIPVHDPVLKECADAFAYEIASQYAWAWPDMKKTTVALQVDCSRSYMRYALMVGTKPDERMDDKTEEVWQEFEEERRRAIAEQAGAAVYDTFPVMLSICEENDLRTALYQNLKIY